MTLAQLGLLIGVLLACCGLGRLILGPAPAPDDHRTAAAQALVGLLVYAATFSLVLQLALPFEVARVLLGAVVALGLAVLGFDLVRRPQHRRNQLAVWLAGLVLLGAVSWLPVNHETTDPISYAFLASTALHPAWVDTQLAGTPLAGVAGTVSVYVASRGAALALLWPGPAASLGVSPDVVAEVSQWFVLVAGLLLVDVVDFVDLGGTPLVARVLIAAAGLGGFSEEAALSAGQIGQAFGIAAATAIIWLDRHLVAAGWRRWLSFALIGYCVATGYPELLAALPLYLGCVVLFKPRRWSEFLSISAAVLIGVLAATLATRGETVAYFAYQTSYAPSAQPVDDPQGPLGVWVWIGLQRPFSRWLLVLLVPATLLAIRLAGSLTRARTSFGIVGSAALVGLVALLGILTWAVLRSGNPNYATFKLSSWVGPALLLIIWALVGLSRGRVRQILAPAVLLFASYRTVGLVWWAGSLALANLQAGDPPAEWYLTETSTNAGCTLHLSPATIAVSVAERAISESAASVRGCAVDGLDRSRLSNQRARRIFARDIGSGISGGIPWSMIWCI